MSIKQNPERSKTRDVLIKSASLLDNAAPIILLLAGLYFLFKKL